MLFLENKAWTLETNIYKLEKKARVGDKYIGSNGTYGRVDARKNKGVAWILLR